MMEELAPADPTRVGPYELLGKLGSGGMGRVYLGRSAAGALAAVKVVHPDLARDPEFRRRFQREVAATVAVSGPHVAAIVHADTEADPPWLATEYVAGLSLAARIDERGPLSPAELTELGARLADGLATIHAAGLVHRDVKPSNILLAADGPKLIDFGIARDTADSRLTRTGVAMGTPLFMAPEQIQGDSAAGPEADVFALAGVLVNAATGGYPFGEGTAVQLLFRIVQEEPRLSGVPDELRPLLTACLDKDPGRRPSAFAVARALGAMAPTVPTVPTKAADAPDVAETWAGAAAAPDHGPNATERLARNSPPLAGPATEPRLPRADLPHTDLPTVALSRRRPTPNAPAKKRNQKAYILTGTGAAAAIIAIVVAITAANGGGSSQAGGGARGGAGLAGAATSAPQNGSGPADNQPGGAAPGANGLSTPGQLNPTGPAAPAADASASSQAGAIPNQPSGTKPGQRPTGPATSGSGSAPAPGTHTSPAAPPTSGAGSSPPPANPPTTSAPKAPTPPVCGTGSCSSLTYKDSVFRSVSTNKCVQANPHGVEYQIDAFGACSGSAAQWRIWYDSSKRNVMFESLLYPGDCFPYRASTLVPCSNSDWVKGAWWETSASGGHLKLTAFGDGGTECATADDVPMMYWTQCKTPDIDSQRWDLQ